MRFLLGWSAWELTESATWVGIVAGLMLAPALLLSPLFGIVSDRINPRSGLLITISLHALIAAIAATAVALDNFTVNALLALSTVLGIFTSAHTPIRLALVPLLVPRQSLPSAIGYSAMIFNTSRILGPALGAWLLTQGSAALAYSCAAALMLAALPSLYATSLRAKSGQKQISPGFKQQLKDGLRYTAAHKAIRLVFGFTLVNALLGRTVIELLPALSGVMLGGDSATLATLTATAGAGSIVGGLVVSRQGGGEKRLINLLALSLALAATLVMILSWASGVRSIAGLIGLLSMTTTIAGTSSQALAQLLVDDSFRGRVLSLWTMVAMGAPAVGAMTMGAMADRLSFPAVLLGFSLLAIAAIAVIYRIGHDE